MAGKHRVRPDTIFVVRTVVLEKKADLRRPHTNLFIKKGLKFPSLIKNIRAPLAKYNKIFHAQRPKFFRG